MHFLSPDRQRCNTEGIKTMNSILCMWTAWYCLWLSYCSFAKCGICVVCCEIVFIIRLGVGLLVVMIWLELCMTLHAPAFNILCFNKHQFTQVHLENGRWNGERCWPVSEHVRLLVDYAKTIWPSFTEFGGLVAHEPRKKPLMLML